MKKTTLGGDAVRLTISKGLALGITFLTAMILARFRTTEEQGTYSQLQLVITLFSSVFMLGLPNSINYFLSRAETEPEKRRFLSVYYTYSTALSLLLGIALTLGTPLIIRYFGNPAIARYRYYLLLYPWTAILSTSIESVAIIYHRTRFLMRYRIAIAVLSLLIVFAVQWTGRGFQEFMALSTLFCVFAVLFVYVYVWIISGGYTFRTDTKLIRTILVFSLPLGLGSVVGTLDIELDKLLIGRLLSTSEMGIYSKVATELPVTIIPASITAVLLPHLTRKLKEGRRKEALELWGVATQLSFLCMALIACGLFTYAEEVIQILYSEKYLSGAPVFRVYAVVLLLRSTYYGTILNASGRSRSIFYCSVAALVLNALLNPLMYYVLGIIGPGIATLVSMLLVSLLQLKLTANATEQSLLEVYPWKQTARIFLFNAALALAFAGLKRILPLERLAGEVVESVVLGLIWTVLYGVLVLPKMKDLWKRLNQGEWKPSQVSTDPAHGAAAGIQKEEPK